MVPPLQNDLSDASSCCHEEERRVGSCWCHEATHHALSLHAGLLLAIFFWPPQPGPPKATWEVLCTPKQGRTEACPGRSLGSLQSVLEDRQGGEGSPGDSCALRGLNSSSWTPGGGPRPALHSSRCGVGHKGARLYSSQAVHLLDTVHTSALLPSH